MRYLNCYMIGEAHHYGVTVSDLEESLGFYRDTLGLEVVSRGHVQKGTDDADKFDDFVGVDGVDVEVVFLDAGGCQVELLKYHEPPGQNANEGVSNNDVGAAHFCLEVDDIDEIYHDLSDDVEFLYEPVTLSKGVRVAYMFDPDGNIVELSDRTLVGE
jgi:catechol 2,3-dioxygenase-like lactoylglutathione lyase family enzyme